MNFSIKLWICQGIMDFSVVHFCALIQLGTVKLGLCVILYMCGFLDLYTVHRKSKAELEDQVKSLHTFVNFYYARENVFDSRCLSPFFCGALTSFPVSEHSFKIPPPLPICLEGLFLLSYFWQGLVLFYVRPHICHGYHGLYLWRKFCNVEKNQISVKNLNKLWHFVKIYAVFVLNLCGEKSVQRKSVWKKSLWRKNDKHEV